MEDGWKKDPEISSIYELYYFSMLLAYQAVAPAVGNSAAPPKKKPGAPPAGRSVAARPAAQCRERRI